MWLLVTGAPGTAKGFVADILQRESFQYLPEPPVSTLIENEFACELGHIFGRLKVQLQAQQLQSRKDILTVRSVWDCAVYLESAKFAERISDRQFEYLTYYVKSLSPLLAPPAAVVFMRTDKMAGYDRVLLKKGVIPHEVEFQKLRELYDDFAARIKIPLIEVDAMDRPEDIKDSLMFNISSLRLTRSADSGIWKREFFFE